MDAMKMDDITLSISSSLFPREGEGPGIGAVNGRIGPGSGNHWSDPYSGADMSSPGSYTYNWSDGKYYDRYGNRVSFDEVFANYVLPNRVDVPYSLFLPSSNQSQKGNNNNQQNVQPVNTYDFIAAISTIILSNSSMMFGGLLQQELTSEILCIIYHSNFKKYYDNFINGISKYTGPEDKDEIASWIFSNSELFPNEIYLNIFPDLHGVTAVISFLSIESPSDRTIDHFGKVVHGGDRLTDLSEYPPFFSYRSYSTLNTSLHYDNIPLIINGHRYNFFMQWRLNYYYTYNP